MEITNIMSVILTIFANLENGGKWLQLVANYGHFGATKAHFMLINSTSYKHMPNLLFGTKKNKRVSGLPLTLLGESETGLIAGIFLLDSFWSFW